MLTPDYLFNCTDRIVEIYEQLQTFAVTDIARRIAKMGTITDTAQFQIWQAQQAGLHYEEILKRVSKLTGMSQAEVKRLFEEAGTQSLKFDDSIYKCAGLNPIPISQSPQMLSVLEALYRQTNGELQKFTRSIALDSQKTFFASSDKAYMEISSGMSDYISAISRSVRETATDGIQVIDYASGSRISVEAGVRRAVLTGVNQGAAKLTEARADEMGCDLVETTKHANARPDHARWQGGIYSLSGKSTKYRKLSDATGYGTVTGLCGANCRHSFSPFILGISEPNETQYNPEEVKKAYDLSQKQRGMERRIRNTKRELNATDVASKTASSDVAAKLKEDYQNQAVKLKRQRIEYETFCRENRLKTQAERTQIPGFSRSEASRATAAARKKAEG
ncbi:phage minor capsid protein [Clostridium sp. KNHs216]|uniref:phage minor capsid protein n=1 Tax=Clostridium sp. KNHs216 TaxID=1550235 RepID=UPI001150251A|nr:phage minor capsid protein [Clostridium sp. KNHs216]TQI66257.1 minor capsid protein 2 [Clostridium sp. KNHs216]